LQAEDRAALETIAAADPERARELGSAWLRHMRAGDFERAWQVSDEVLRSRKGESPHSLPRHFQWVWDGEPLNDKRVLIRCYHGLGDTIQFIRYAPLVRRIARRVVVWAQPTLLPLLETAEGIDELLPLHEGVPEVEYDVDVESMELPHVFRSTVGTLPATVPYFHLKAAELPRDQNLRVGLVWRCGDWAPERAVPIGLLLPLGDTPGVTLHLMQVGEALNERPPGFGVVSADEDLFRAAQTIAALDLMISIDSMPAHLAGALGVPTWTLLRSDCDWRWMADRQDTPWYPTMRLFRQSQVDEWERVVARVMSELSALAAGRRSPRATRPEL
jgi:hypothetical protein